MCDNITDKHIMPRGKKDYQDFFQSFYLSVIIIMCWRIIN